MGRLISAMDWSATPLGPVEGWPQTLRALLHVVLNSRHPMFLWWGPELIQFYNDGYRPSLGEDRHPAALGARGREFWSDIWESIGPQIQGALERGESTWHEDDLVPIVRNGRTEDVYWTYSFSPVLDDDNRVGGVLVIVQETTHRVVTERRTAMLRALAERTAVDGRTVETAWRVAADVVAAHAGDVTFMRVYTLDDQGGLQAMPGPNASPSGVPPGIDGRPAESDEDAGPVARVAQTGLAEIVRGGKVRSLSQAVGLLPAGEVQAMVLPVAHQGQDRPYGIMVLGRNPRIAFDETYREFLELIARQVATAIANARLYDLSRTYGIETARLLAQAQEAIRAREDMLATVSHDLLTPLSAILTAAQLLQRTWARDHSDERVPGYVEKISRSGGRIQRLIADLLDLASIDAGTLSLELGVHTVEELLRETLETFGPRAVENGVTLTTESTPELPAVPCDKGRVLQVLANLVSNAIKFTPEHGSVHIRTGLDAGGAHVRFVVTDTGRGIRAEDQAFIFDRHWHVTRRNRDGHGLGLSIAAGIVASHGGRIHVESTAGSGSTFSFTLPLEARAEETAVAGRQARPAPVQPGHDRTFIAEGGEMGALMRSIDWSGTPLGPIDRWPQSLRTSVSTVLRSPYPIILFWGPELCMLYNDPFRPILGAKHPRTMGARGHEALAEAWELLGPLMARAFQTGAPIYVEDGNVNFERRPGGLKEEAYFTWSYNPTIGETGEIAGLFAIASETTRQVVGDRRLATLRELSIRTALDREVQSVFHSLEDGLAQAGADVPFALLYVVTGDQAELVACTGLTRGGPAAPLRGGGSPWPLHEVARSGVEQLVEDLDASLGALPGGPWPEPATRALVLPVTMGADAQATAVLVAGLSPLRPLDDEYRSFLQLMARQLGASVSSARAYEQERHKADVLAALDQAKTEFFSNISHEFRTPLTLIVGPIEDALGTARDLSRDELDLIRRNALRLHRMVNALLEFSRIEAGRADVAFVPTDLSAFTCDLASMFDSAAASAGLTLVVDCAPLPAPVYVDPDMWEKVVFNLLSNALKYTHHGDITVTMRSDGPTVTLTVADTGVGIPADELPLIFQRFHRVRGNAGRSHEGTGIGLALVQELARLHGGSVHVDSTLGKGTTVTVTLRAGSSHLPADHVVEGVGRPRGSSADSAAAYVEEARRWASRYEVEQHRDPVNDAPPGDATDVRSARILLVDDNADLRAYVKGILERAFSTVITAADGEDGLETARRLLPDLVLSDVMMPRLDGFGLVRELRRDERTAAIPVILLSARTGEAPTVEGLGTGADDYLVKPFSSRELLARVQTHLSMARVRRQAAHQELIEDELRQSIRMRDEFLSAASHELRTPLTTLGLQVDMLLRMVREMPAGKVSLDDLVDKLDRVRRQTLRLEHLVDMLLDSAGIAAGTAVTDSDKADLASIARDVVGTLADEAARAGTPLSLVGAPTPGRWHRARVALMLTHLVKNAIKFGGGNPIDVRVEAGEGTSRIVVRDRGIGIAPDQQGRIFERLERGVSIDDYGGLGLGLWIVGQLAHAMHGTVRVESQPGEGSTFIVELPEGR